MATGKYKHTKAMLIRFLFQPFQALKVVILAYTQISIFICHSVLQGGMYVFQLLDYYSCNGACIFFLTVFQSLAVGWAFGELQTLNLFS